MNAIEVGSLVSHKTGGPVMLVTRIEKPSFLGFSKDMASVEWMDRTEDGESDDPKPWKASYAKFPLTHLMVIG